MTLKTSISQCWQSQLKLLTFRSTEAELLAFGKKELLWGLFWVWMAGLGRTWDDGSASIFQKSGLPSVIYIFLLSFYLWVFLLPLRPRDWSLKRLTTFVSMTGIVAIIYAIPLEMIMSPENAATGNAIFLGIVAVWRVALLAFFLSRTSHWRFPTLLVALLLPLSTIINVLLYFDTDVHTFEFMGGIRRYYVIANPEIAKRSREKVAKEANESNFLRYSVPVPAIDYQTGKTIPNVYLSYYPPLEGYMEVQWGDPRYISTTPLMNTLRQMEKVSRFLWPIMAIYYLAVGFIIPFWVSWNKQITKESK